MQLTAFKTYNLCAQRHKLLHYGTTLSNGCDVGFTALKTALSSYGCTRQVERAREKRQNNYSWRRLEQL